MKNQRTLLLAVLICVLSVGAVMTAVADDYPAVADVLGMTPVTETSCAAVWVPVGKAQALAGVTWYNNDGLMEFPEVLVASGTSDEPVALTSCSIVADNVMGSSSAWSTVAFDAPVASKRGGFYVLFRFPEGSEQEAVGAGGGAGIGYVEGGGLTGWLSADGEDWVKVGRSYGFAVVAEYVPAEEGMAEKSGRMFEPGEKEQAPESKVFETALLPPAPNPFNPTTDIRFTLKEPARVEVAIYDMKGRLVTELVRQTYPSGEHAVTWEGRDTGGRRVSSGVYFVHLRTGESAFTRRVMLVK